MIRVAVPFAVVAMLLSTAPLYAGPVSPNLNPVLMQAGCSCQGQCPCHGNGTAASCPYCRQGSGGGGGMPNQPEEPAGPSNLCENERVRFFLQSDEDIDADRLIRGLARVRGLSNPSVEGDFVTCDYTGSLDDLQAIERTMSSGRVRAYLYSHARVQISLQPANNDADPRELRTELLALEAVRYAETTRGEAVVWVNLETTCVCAVLERCRNSGFNATAQSHLDARVQVSGDGDMEAFLTALRGITGTIKAEEGDNGVHFLAAGRVNRRDIENAAEDAGFSVDEITSR